MWYYALNDTQMGPVSMEELLEKLKQGELTKDTLVWKAGMSGWMPVGSVHELKDCIQAISTPPPLEHTPDNRKAPMATCSECGASRSVSEMTIYDGHFLCPNCKGPFLNKKQAQDKSREYSGNLGKCENSARICAFILDNIFLLIVFIVLWLAMSVSSWIALSIFPDAIGFILTGMLHLVNHVATILAYGLYEGYFLSRQGATPGKKMMHLVVLHNGEKPSFQRAFARGACHYLSGLCFMVGYIIGFFTPEHKALHDYICDTIVFSKKD